jgi:hypothetical protein
MSATGSVPATVVPEPGVDLISSSPSSGEPVGDALEPAAVGSLGRFEAHTVVRDLEPEPTVTVGERDRRA